MIVASFFAPRPEHPRWRDYLPSLWLLQASCDRAGLRHVILGDAPVDGFEVLQVPGLPRDLMGACLAAQRHGIGALDDDLLLVGADCVVVQDAEKPIAAGADLTVTLGDFWDCRMNTGTIWIRRGAREAVAALWARAIDGMGTAWGDDQLALAAQVAPLPMTVPTIAERSGLTIQYLDVDPWNLAPDRPDHDCSHAKVLHFRGNRKLWAATWCQRFLGWSA